MPIRTTRGILFGSRAGAKEAAETATEQAGRRVSQTSSSWANNLRRATIGSTAIGGGAYTLGKAGDAIEQRSAERETEAWLEERRDIIDDPHLSQEKKEAYLANMEHPDGGGGGFSPMEWLDDLSITQAIMLLAFSYVGVRGLAILGGMAG